MRIAEEEEERDSDDDDAILLLYVKASSMHSHCDIELPQILVLEDKETVTWLLFLMAMARVLLSFIICA